MYRILFIIFSSFIIFVFISCAPDEELYDLQSIVIDYNKEGKDVITNKKYAIRKTADNIINNIEYNGKVRGAQGMAVRNNVMYRLYDTGICQTLDISDIDNPQIMYTFELGSYISSNHCNCAQFLPQHSNEESTYLYIAGLKGKCFVEKIKENSSTLFQTITLGELEIFDKQNRFNIICGDDSYLYLFGEEGTNQKLYFAKIKRPNIEDGDYTITKDDILDYWYEPNYRYSESVWQGGKVYNGKLHFVFGTTSSKRQIIIYDMNNHSKVEIIELDDYISEELEDIEIVNNNIIIVLYGGKGYYIISDVKNT